MGAGGYSTSSNYVSLTIDLWGLTTDLWELCSVPCCLVSCSQATQGRSLQGSWRVGTKRTFVCSLILLAGIAVGWLKNLVITYHGQRRQLIRAQSILGVAPL